MVSSQKYLAIFRLAILHSLRNYKPLIGLSIFLVTCLLIFAHLWKVMAVKMNFIGFQPNELLWYIALNQWVLVSIPDIQEEIEEDLRSGRLAYLLPRPISYLGAVFCEGLGILCVNLVVLGSVSFLFTFARVGSIPFGLSSFFAATLLGFFAGCVATLFLMLIGVSSFWLREVGPFVWIWEKFLFALGGLMFPLAVYPYWLTRVAYWTPFPAILGQRSALAIHFTWPAVMQVWTALSLWSLLALFTMAFLYRRARRILSVEGG